MPHPNESRQKGDLDSTPRLPVAELEKFLRKKEKRDRRRGVPEDADKMIPGRREKEDRVVKGVTEPLEGR
jgi:hypothetical protein